MSRQALGDASTQRHPFDRWHLVTRGTIGVAGGVVGLALLFASGAGRPDSIARGAQVGKNLKRIVLALHVYEVGVFREIPPIDWGDGTIYRRGLCFDKPALDLATERKVGEATVCFVDVRDANGGQSARIVTFLALPPGQLVARHQATLQPLLDPNSPATHLVGAMPPPEERNVVGTTGGYRGVTGQARIAGLVDLEHFRMDEESGIKFHEWVYVIDLHPSGR